MSVKRARIIVGLHCNYQCSYCVNDTMPHLLAKFKEIECKDLNSLVKEYDEISITGGEPLLQLYLPIVRTIVSIASVVKAKVFIYTNLTRFPTSLIPYTEYIDGWTIGYHKEYAEHQTKRLEENLKYIKDRKNVRILAESGLTVPDFGIPVKYYIKDECDISNKEDWYIIREPKYEEI